MAEYNSVIPLLLQTLEKPTHCRGMVAVERWAERADEYSAELEEEIKKGQEEAAKLTEKIEKLRSEKLDVYDAWVLRTFLPLPQCCSQRVCFRSARQQD